MVQKIQVRAPMLPLLAGLILGLILARQPNASILALLSFAVISCTGALWLSYSRKNFQHLWLPLFIISSALCFWVYGIIRLPQAPTPAERALPEREAQLTLEIRSVMQSKSRYTDFSGIAQVLETPKAGQIQAGERIYCSINHTETALQRGHYIQLTGVLRPLTISENTSNFSSFDAYLKEIGVHYRFSRTSELQIIKRPSGFARFCTKMNVRFQKILQQGAPQGSDLANIYVTMLLGQKAALTDEQNDRYKTTGTLHFFAISGLHIGIIATVIANCLLLIRVPRKWSPVIGLPLLYLYVEIIGASPSAMRAFLMAAFFWASFAFYRQHSSMSALVCSAIAVLMIDPLQLWSLGFQLSYIVVSSILLLGLPLHRFLMGYLQPYKWSPEESWSRRQRGTHWLLDKTVQLFAISLSAWLASAPLCAQFFGFIAPAAIILNMLLVHLVAIVIISGVLSLGCASIPFFEISTFINHSAWIGIYAMDAIVLIGTHIPTVQVLKDTLPVGYSHGLLVIFLLSLGWLHRNPGRLMTAAICLPIVISLSGVGIAVFAF